ncbi:MAG: beta-lactamase family protein [Roseiflexus sp.]|nr:beta-lactamase family protein [Roseiflexus sp.]MBO9334258.1 beta-lactamase family protein [Roseiflexus sp.]MBO9364711.1 beta-lactamase family protein [Roseiflexus sp.]MBO9383567.1 beta-lactamase family protein [Roseiflexus sp.]
MPIPAIDAIIASAIDQRIFPGAVVLVARDAEILHIAAYGTMTYDPPGNDPVTPATIYDIASLTKVFTATAALLLYDRGSIDLAAPVQAYLPRFRARDVTVWHLLTHTSGLDLRLSMLRRAGREGLLAAAYSALPVRPPGSSVAYTNINSFLLGEIVAAVYGQPLDRAIDELVCRPLKLQHTGFRPDPALIAHIAPTEFDREWRGCLVHGVVHDESAYALGGVAGHAGLFSIASDLWTFCRAWLPAGSNHHPAPLLKPTTLTLAITNQTPELAQACGLGWMIDRPNFMGSAPRGSYGHTGFTGPALVIVPHDRLIIIVLSNRVHPQRSVPRHHAVTAAIVAAALDSMPVQCSLPDPQSG